MSNLHSEPGVHSLGDFGVATYRTIVDQMEQGVLVYDSRRILGANAQLCPLLDCPPELVIHGTELEQFIRFGADRGDYAAGAGLTLQSMRMHIATGKDYVIERQLPDGRTIRIDCRHRHGMMFVTYTDVTDARARELQLQQTELEVRKLAEIDSLTNLTNRRAFDDELSTRIKARRDGSDDGVLALILLDLDRFKPVNDTYGHALGDVLLQILADRFREVIRKRDTMARIGGDEFAAIIEVDCTSDAIKLAGRLRHAAKKPAIVRETEIEVDASVGIAFLSSDTAGTEDFLMAADLALYAAKDQGRGTIRTYEPVLAENAKKRYSLEQDLRSAVENNELVLYYQVQRDLRTNRNVGYEALMRWQHPTRGLVMPVEFIPLAEETGLIVEMGRWALRQAATDFATLDQSTRVAVNVSPVQFVKSDLVADVTGALQVSGLEAHRLEIEITEDVLIEDTDNTEKVLSELSKLGVSLSLDDFGSGYSSLAYLTQFPFTKLKIDRCFTERILLDDRSRALVTSILALASSLGIKVTAEGVETSGQLAMLTEGSCDEAQGYLLGKPEPFQKAFADR